MKNSVVKVQDYIPETFEIAAAVHRTTLIAAQCKTLRMFGVVGITDSNVFQRTKNFLLDIGCPIMYSEKKGLIWVREIGESLDRLFSGLSKFS